MAAPGQVGRGTQVVSGVVRAEDGAPVSGATVRVQTTTHSTTSGRDGRFSLSVPEPGEQLERVIRPTTKKAVGQIAYQTTPPKSS